MDRIAVVGTNDLTYHLTASGITATHFLVRREYIKNDGGTVDHSYPVLFEYNHYGPDSEFVEVARKRGVFKPCQDAIVEHMQASAGKSDVDDTTRKNQLKREEDRATFLQRRRLWKE